MQSAFASLLPTPLHPAVVHLPMALVVLLPVFAIGALLVVRRGGRPLRAWGVTTAMFAALSLSAWASLETGEDQDEAVESVVPEAPLETHEEAAEQFLWLSVGVLGVAAVGLLGGKVGTSARILATIGSAGLLVAGYNVGHSGGALLYQYGAASAYVRDAAGTTAQTTAQTTAPNARPTP
jgi:hypothetical protein